MKEALKLATSTVVGLVATFLTGFFPSPTLHPSLGSARFGTPLPWFIQIIYPNEPRIFRWAEFTVDVAFWTLIIYLGYRVIRQRWSRPR